MRFARFQHLCFRFFTVTTIQTIQYYNRYPDGSILAKSLVAFLWTLDLLHLMMITHVVYFYTISNYMNSNTLDKITWSLIALIAVTSSSDFIVRGAFTFQLWKVYKGRKSLILPIGFFSLAIFVLGLAWGVRCAQAEFFQNLSSVSPFVYLSICGTVISSLLTSFSFCILQRGPQKAFNGEYTFARLMVIHFTNVGVLTSSTSMPSFRL